MIFSGVKRKDAAVDGLVVPHHISGRQDGMLAWRRLTCTDASLLQGQDYEPQAR